MATSARRVTKGGQVGDGRERALAEYIESHAQQGSADDVLAKIDEFAYEQSFLVNVGDEKGQVLDAAVVRANPGLAVELGTYCGYGALRIARAAPSARVLSVEFSADNADVARRVWAHAGVGDRVQCVVGSIGDGGRTLDVLTAEHGLSAGGLDFLFIDHDKAAYVADLLSILGRGWLHRGSIILADNVLIPGAPKYRAYMRQHEGTTWRTVEHKAHVEYQTLMPDLMLESEYLG
jgi:catechol O-methyltransferase